MRSTWNYPIFQAKRDEMEIRPLRHRSKAGLARYVLEDWRERGYEQKYRAMIAQKREPIFWASRRFHKNLGSSQGERR